jgi:hypothetical protein
LACQLGDTERNELETRYRFHLAVQEIHAQVTGHLRNVQHTLNALAGQRQVESWQFQQALAVLRAAHDALLEQLDAARGLYLPPLTNMTAGAPLGPFLRPDPMIDNIPASTQTLDGAWIGQLMNQMGGVADKLARILFKSLGGILALQESMADRWAARVPAPDAVEEPAASRSPDPSPVQSS